MRLLGICPWRVDFARMVKPWSALTAAAMAVHDVDATDRLLRQVAGCMGCAARVIALYFTAEAGVCTTYETESTSVACKQPLVQTSWGQV